MQFNNLKKIPMASDDQKILQYLKRKYGTKTTTELLLKVENLATIMRRESCKEMYSSKFKSEFSGEPESEAELAIKE
jgi:hypothetical protein